jgi:DNA-binding transcriptional LysR family regulator
MLYATLWIKRQGVDAVKLAQLKYFQTVCHYNSVTKAAGVLNVAQPSISASIRSLEAEFGVDLFKRVKQQLILTKEGSFLLEYANELLDMASSLEQKMLDLGKDRTNLRIAVPPMTGTFAFNELFFAYHERFPKAEIEIIESGSTKNLLSVADESVDLALATTGVIVNEQLNILQLKPVRIVLCVSASHRLAKASAINFEMLKDERLILFRKGSKHNEFIEQRFAEIGVNPRVLLYSSQIHTIQEFVAKDLACAFVFDGITDLFKDTVKIPIPDLPSQNVSLIWKKAKHLNNRERYLFHEVSQFVSFAKEFTCRGGTA